MTQLIKLENLRPDARNANVCSDEMMQKLKINIERTQLYPPLTVRPKTFQPGHYTIVDGHHRYQVLKELGYQEVECQIWDISDTEAQIALMTLNRLRGEDNPVKRAELLEGLTAKISLDELALFLPESRPQLQDLLSLRQLDVTDLEEALKKEVKSLELALPVPFAFMISPKNVPLVEKALNYFTNAKKSKKKKGDLSQSFLELCKFAVLEKEHEEKSHEAGA